MKRKLKSFKKSKLFALKAMIKGCVAEAGVIRKEIHASSGVERYELWNKKRSLGVYARHLMLAYAFLRNIPFSKLEKDRELILSERGFVYENHYIDLTWIRILCVPYIKMWEKELTNDVLRAWIKEDVLFFEPRVSKSLDITVASANLQ